MGLTERFTIFGRGRCTLEGTLRVMALDAVTRDAGAVADEEADPTSLRNSDTFATI
jgi:hypothetical protein